MSLGFMLTGVFCVVTFFFPTYYASLNGFIIFFCNIPFCIIPVYASEFYPTHIRSIGLGVNIVWTRLGAILTPFISEMLYSISMFFPYVVFAILSFIGMYISYILPVETLEKPLDTMDLLIELKEKKSIEEEK